MTLMTTESTNEGGTTGNTGTTTASTSGSTTSGTSTGTTSASWRDTLPEEMRNDPSLQSFSDVTNLAKSYLHTKQQVGKKGIIAPTDKSTDEEWNAFYKAIGQPDFDKYEVKVPEGFKANEEFMGAFKKAAHESGILPKQAQKLFDWYNTIQAESAKAGAKAKEVETKEKLEGLKKEWGHAYDQELGKAKAGLKHLNDPELQSWLDESGLGNEPKMIKLFNKIGGLFSEDTIRGESSGRAGALTPREIEAELATIFSNKAYFNSRDPMHKVYAQRAEELFKMKAGS